MDLAKRQARLALGSALALHLLLMGVYLGKFGGDLSVLVGASDRAVGRAPLEAVTTSIGPGGYDGMFYYALARDPWRVQSENLDLPAYRHGRILYPALCWLLSGGGDAQGLFWVMPMVNLALIAGLAWLGIRVAQTHGMNPWWGFVLPLAINACIPALRNLTDNLSTLLVFGLLAAWAAPARWWLPTLLGAAAVLTREQNVLAVGVVLLGALWQRRLAVALGMAACLVLAAAWMLALRAQYGLLPFQGTAQVVSAPLGGLTYAWLHLGGHCHSTRLAICNGLSLLQMGILIVVSVYAAWEHRSMAAASLSLFGVLLAVCATHVIWDDMMCYRRALVWIPLGIWIAGIESRKPWLLYPLIPGGLFSVAAALGYV